METVNKDGMTYTLKQQDAYLNKIDGHSFYEASALGEDGNDYIIKWEITAPFDAWNNVEEDQMCDWDEFNVEKLGG